MSEWQPIETAPKDGTFVLVCWPLQGNVMAVAYHRMLPTPRWEIRGEFAYLTGTVWQPLPPPPAPQAEAPKERDMSTTIETWMPEARQLAAQCWCDDETKHVVMIPELAEAVAKRIAAWMETGAFHARNEAYWRERAHKAEGISTPSSRSA